MRALMTIDCENGSDIMVEVTPEQDIIFHGYDHEAKLAEIGLGFSTPNDPCLIAYSLLRKVVNGEYSATHLLRDALSGKALAWKRFFYPPVELVDILLALGADPDEPIEDSRHTLLSLAVHQGKLNAAKKLLEAGADPNLPEEKPTLLHAAERGFHKAIPLLAMYGADLEGQGTQALASAITSKHPNVVEELIDLGVDGNEEDPFDDCSNLLRTAIAWSDGRTDIVEMLIAAGADISVDNYEAIRLAKDLGYNEIETLLREQLLLDRMSR